MREDQLLQRFSAKGSEAAFGELVRRHLDFVYCICRRKLGDRELAQDVTQSVFLLLAAKAGSFRPGTALSGWLFQTAHHACQNALRSEARRRHYERKAAQEMDAARGWDGGEPWLQVEPVLDDALAGLGAADRDAILLRFVEEMSPEEMAIALGISAAAAQKRVSRALERLRRGLGRAGTALTITMIGVMLTEKAVQAAPPAVAANILKAVTHAGLGTALAGPGSAASSLGAPASHSLALSKAQVALAAIVLGGIALGVGAILLGRSGPPKPISRGVPAAAGTGLPLLKRITLRGSVLNAGGGAAADAAVSILRLDPVDGAMSQFAEVRTDRVGRYAASGPAPDQDRWVVVADSGIRLGFGVPGAPCVLPPPTRLRLRLVGVDGRPLAGLRVQPLLLSGLDVAGRPQTINLTGVCPERLVVRSDPTGIASFDGLPQGFTASFAILDQRYQRRPPSADGLPLAGDAESGDFVVSVALGASVSGRLVYDTTGLPAAGVRIGAQDTSTSAWGEAQTDADGRFRIIQLPQGRYNVAVDEQSLPLEGGWTAAALQGVVLGPGQALAGGDLRLVRGTLIQGRVTLGGSGRPVAGTEIGAYGPAHPATGAWVSGGWTRWDGAYQIRVPPGRQHVYSMGVSAGGGADVVTRDGQDAVVDFALSAPSVAH